MYLKIYQPGCTPVLYARHRLHRHFKYAVIVDVFNYVYLIEDKFCSDQRFRFSFEVRKRALYVVSYVSQYFCFSI